MTPSEAGALDLGEPDWRARFGEHFGRFPRLPVELAEDEAFEAVLKDWRRFHFTWVEGKRKPAGAVEAMIALAGLRIFPPRSLIKNVPRDGRCYEPDVGDAHCWLQISQRMWRIQAVESRTLFLDSFGEGMQVNLATAKWEKYLEAAVAALDALARQ